MFNRKVRKGRKEQTQRKTIRVFGDLRASA